METCAKCYKKFEIPTSDHEGQGLCDACIEHQRINEAREQRLGHLAVPMMLIAVTGTCVIYGFLIGLMMHFLPYLFESENDFLPSFLIAAVLFLVGPFLLLKVIAERISPSVNLTTNMEYLVDAILKLVRKPLPLLCLILSYGSTIGSSFAVIKLMNIVAFLSEEDITKLVIENDFYDFDRNKNGKGIQNNYESYLKDTIIVDHTTGLYWQQRVSTSDYNIRAHEEMYRPSSFIKYLNRRKDGGYDDWRLPTLKEALSLVEPEKSLKGFRINSLFKVPDENIVIITSDKYKRKNLWAVNIKHGFCVHGSSLFSWGKILAVRSDEEKTKENQHTTMVKNDSTHYTRFTIIPFSFELPNSWIQIQVSESDGLRRAYEQQFKQVFLQYGNLQDYDKLEWELLTIHVLFAPQKEASASTIVIKLGDTKSYLDQLERNGNERIQWAIHQKLIRNGSTKKTEVDGKSAIETEMETDNSRLLIFSFYLPDHPDKLIVLQLSCVSEKYSMYAPVFEHVVKTLRFTFADGKL